jgi:hypothetical protein
LSYSFSKRCDVLGIENLAHTAPLVMLMGLQELDQRSPANTQDQSSAIHFQGLYGERPVRKTLVHHPQVPFGLQR